MKLNNPMTLYMMSMGKLYVVTHVCQELNDANLYCKEHPKSGVIATDEDGNIFIAKLEPSFFVTVPISRSNNP